MSLLEVKNLHVEVEDKKILRGLTLTIEKGQVAAIMGPNGSGKSTLAYVLAGKDNYHVTEGDVLLDGESILGMAPDERAAKGLFLAFQYPVEVLDETDSGLDIDALKIVSDGVNRLRSPERSMIVITHYQRLLNYIVPDVVHVMAKGKVVKSGGKELALELEATGYAQFADEAA